MNDIIKTLMERDGLTLEEATAQYKETRAEINSAIEEMDPWEAYEYVEDLMAGDLGLEMDYIFDML